ncbi:MAG: lysozyme inhibitor [Pleurocapsa sp. SU_196_0]|nr:lysozyme inhibitor [Pleurocapsa sp. SU_196_0]
MNKIVAVGILSLVTVLGSSVAAAPTTVKYTCQRGSKVQVTYNGNRARLVLNNKVYLMTQTSSASGVRYIGGGYTWWTKGNTGDLYWGTNLNTMKSLDACRER